jgi:hypothetical protein
MKLYVVKFDATRRHYEVGGSSYGVAVYSKEADADRKAEYEESKGDDPWIETYDLTKISKLPKRDFARALATIVQKIVDDAQGNSEPTFRGYLT